MLARLMAGTDIQLRRRDVIRRFDRAAARFGEFDFVHRHAFDGLVERLEPMAISPTRILDLGAAAGAGSRALAKAYPKSRVTAVDLSARMLEECRRARWRFARIREVRADARALPFPAGAFDLVVANLLLPWLPEPEPALTEVGRVLQKEGLFLFSTLGPSSLAVLRDAGLAAGNPASVHTFADMHDVGDALVAAGLADPVIDTDRYQVRYRSAEDLFRDLSGAGGRNALAGRRRGLTARAAFDRLRQALAARSEDGNLTVELELVYGHAWGAGPRPTPGEHRIDPATIGRRRD